MEAVLQQECSTESQLETYKSQLGLVEGQLEAGAGGAENTADLQQLQEDLTQLITLTEEALLDLKKQRLLLSVQSLDSRAAGGGICSLFDNGTESRGGEEASREGLEEEEGEREEDDSDDLQGMKCRAPLEEAWGAVNYHNAVIFCRDDGCSESSDGDEGRNGVKVRVLFTHPTYKAMKPCPYYLNGKCRFDDGSCKFSHGHVVLFSDLLTYREPDYNLACIGGKCIAKHSDDLWYPAIISSLDEVFTIHFTTLNTTVEKPLENVFPLEVSESSDSSASSESGEEEEGGEEGVRVVEWTPSGALRALGEWERHTTGIGSRLLAKMGYVVGKGLGRNGEGRVEPVEIKILPAGKSLDMCAEMRERGKLRKAPGEGEGKRKRKRKRKRKLVEAARLQEAETEKVDIFDFLNTKLQKNTPAGKVEDRLGSKPKSGNLNIQLFTVQEEIKSVLKRRQSLKTQLARHKGRDKTMEEHVTEKLTAVGRELERLHAEERSIERSLTLKSERKKLRIF